MSKVLTDQIEKRTGGTAMDVPATGKWPQGNIADDAVGTAQLAATGTASATTFLRGDNSWATVDTSGIDANKEDIALLAFKTQANGNLARYNLVDQSVDSFEDASGINTPASSDANRDSSGKYYSGQSGGAAAVTAFTATGAGTWTCPAGITSAEILVVAGGGVGGNNHGGGGGAGGVVHHATYPTTAGVVYDLTVGAGYSANRGGNVPASTGDNSSFNDNNEGSQSKMTALGGGSGAGASYTMGGSGGSGGGAGGHSSPGSFPYAATQGPSGGGTGYGFAGSTQTVNSMGTGGGGGGATAQGATTNT